MEALTAKTRKGVKFKWTSEMDAAFNQIKLILAKDTMLTYMCHGVRFHIHMDASNKKMGSVVSQNGKPIAFFLRKLNSLQKQ